MIVKVQASLTDGGKHVLVYNRDSSWFFQGEMTPHMRKKLDGRIKAFFYATRIATIIDVGAPAPEQDW